MKLDARFIPVLMTVLACAGRSAPAALPTLCVLERPAGAGEPDAATWMALLLRGYDAATRRVTSPPLDCTGAQVRWDGPAFRCDEGSAATTLLPDRPLDAGDVVTSPVSADSTLVWVATTRFATGDAAGPVALVTSARARLRVVALGVLRGYREDVRLRLEDLGPTKVLVADGKLCAGTEHGACIRASRLVPLRGARFVPMPLVGEDGQCLSAAWFDIARRERRRSSRGWEWMDFSATMAFSGGRLAVEEQVVVHDAPVGEERAPAHVLNRAQSTRQVRWEPDRLVASGTALWWRVAYGEPR